MRDNYTNVLRTGFYVTWAYDLGRVLLYPRKAHLLGGVTFKDWLQSRTGDSARNKFARWVLQYDFPPNPTRVEIDRVVYPNLPADDWVLLRGYNQIWNEWIALCKRERRDVNLLYRNPRRLMRAL